MAGQAYARCLMRGCAVRFRSGPDRLCPMHTEDTGDSIAARMAAFTALSAIPGEREDSDATT